MQFQFINDQKTWENLADIGRAPLPQRWIYGDAARLLGRDVHRIALYDQNNTPVAIAQGVSRRILGMNIILFTRGPIILKNCDTGAVRRAIRRAIKTVLRKPSICLMTPDQKMSRFGFSRRPQASILDLSPELDVLQKQLHSKWRNALRKSKNARVKPARLTATPEALMPLLQAEKSRQSENKYRALPPEFTLALQKSSPKSLDLFNALDAQMLFIRHGNTATYQMGHSGTQGRAAAAHNALLWRAIEVLKSQGVIELDLGTIDTKRAPDLARFKRRSGAKEKRLGAATFV